MEPAGGALSPPGPSLGALPSPPAQNPSSLHLTSQQSCSLPGLDRVPSRGLWCGAPEGAGEGVCGRAGQGGGEGGGEGLDVGRRAQRSFRSSAFPSSLTWDSDSEKETLDEEELQHFSNPHGLAAHSPGSPSSGLRLDSEEDKPLPLKTHTASPLEGRSLDMASTQEDELNTLPLSSAETADDKVCNAPVASVTPKTQHQIEEEEGEEEEEGGDGGMNKGNDRERDVYSFPGDSDGESPPPAPWAHCTFIQRQRRKRALLRPFSGLAGPPTWQRSPPTWQSSPPTWQRSAAGARRGTPEPPQEAGGVDDFREEEAAVGEKGGEGGRGVKQELEQEIFTCVECSIYFKKQIHLQDHMTEHAQSASGVGRRGGRGGRFRCVECGWCLASRLALAEHQGCHQESRHKILEGIRKLGGEGAGEGGLGDEGCRERKLRGPRMVVKLGSSASDLAPVPVPDPVSTPASTPASTTASRRGVHPGRRRYFCSKCDFSTRTSQALANHAKTHNRKRSSALQRTSTRLRPQAQPPGGDQISGQRGFRELPGSAPPFQTSGAGEAEELGPVPGAHQLTGLCSTAEGRVPEGRAPPLSMVAREGGSSPGALPPKRPSLRPPRELAFKSIGTRRTSRRGSSSTQPPPTLDNTTSLPGAERPQGHDEDQDQGSDMSVLRQNRLGSQVESRPVTRARCMQDDTSPRQQKLPASCPIVERVVKQEEEEEEEEEEERTVSLARSAAFTKNHKEEEEEEDEEERVRRFLAESILAEEEEEEGEEEESGILRGVDRKCPYCPDHFHNGIGLANHVRGHLNRVGVSYNVRHFISPEEVNAIERKFSYQKKKKKVANFDPDTFSVMRCEFCSAGFDTRAGLSSHARAHLRDFGITNWEVTVSPIHILRELFSSRPDLALPTAPPRSPGTQEDEGEEEGGERTRAASKSSLVSLPLPQAWMEEPRREHADARGLLRCDLCGAPFETRRGLSSHARSHLRQLGVGLSESSGAPIHLLYQITKERGHELPVVKTTPSPRPPIAKTTPSPLPALASQKQECDEDMDSEDKPVSLSPLAPTPSPASSPPPPALARPYPPSPSSSPFSSPGVRKAPISSLLPVSSPLRPSGGGRSLADPSSSKPFWAPQETDAPLNLTLEVDPTKDIICQLCGAWFETRKGLSSHARAHLRHFGVEYSESRGSPIDLLDQLIHTDDFKHRASTLSSTLTSPKRPLSSSSSPLLYKVTSVGGGAGSKATSSLIGPAPKRAKPSQIQVFRLSGELMPLPHSEPTKEIACEFCGEFFENRKGLSSHARSHLRQMGITEWTVNGSPIDTLREVITHRGLPCALPLRPLKTPPPSPGPSPASPSSAVTLLSRLPFAFAHPSASPTPARKPTAPPPAASSLVAKLKPEPVQLEVTLGGRGAGGGRRFGSEALKSWSSSDGMLPLNLAVAQEAEPTRDIRCEFCGEFFENRKGLSSHARSHLRQMGITEWTVNGSPIDTLREVMLQRGGAQSPPPTPGVKREGGGAWEGGGAGLSFQRKSALNLLHSGSRLHRHGLGSLSPGPLGGKLLGAVPLGKRPLLLETPTPPGAFSPQAPLPPDLPFRGKSSPDKQAAGHQDASCELCGFYFENRKALASHARAHLRQFGVTEWCVNGSPIETLSAWMKSRPPRLLDMHRCYTQGSRREPPRMKSSSSVSPSSSPDHALSSSQCGVGVSPGAHVGVARSAGAESGPFSAPSTRPSPATHSHTLTHPQVARSELNVRLPRGFERRPPKHPSHPEEGEGDSAPPRPPRSGTVPSLVPRPPSSPLVTLVGKLYTLKCRFCEVEFQGPLSIQEAWIRHLQQHILQLNYTKPASPCAAPGPASPCAAPVPASPCAAPGPASPCAAPGPASGPASPCAAPDPAPGPASPSAAPGRASPSAAPGPASPCTAPGPASGPASPSAAPGPASPSAAPGPASPRPPSFAVPPVLDAPASTSSPSLAAPHPPSPSTSPTAQSLPPATPPASPSLPPASPNNFSASNPSPVMTTASAPAL
ncbi:protein Wiz-like [Osmerus mordax]|uniref:protein Wiz-like n=1 Tax=Osmerus mordax TaxID=8014 RepID=UPI003510881A